MSGPKITFEQLEAEVRRLAEERPDYIYHRPDPSNPSCYYRNPDGTPGCIFGQAFEALGYEILPGRGPGGVVGAVAYVLFALDIETTSAQALWAGAVQMKQDAHTRWGEAVAAADVTYPLNV